MREKFVTHFVRVVLIFCEAKFRGVQLDWKVMTYFEVILKGTFFIIFPLRSNALTRHAIFLSARSPALLSKCRLSKHFKMYVNLFNDREREWNKFRIKIIKFEWVSSVSTQVRAFWELKRNSEREMIIIMINNEFGAAILVLGYWYHFSTAARTKTWFTFFCVCRKKK